MKQVFISKVACATALGLGPDRLWQGLLAGECGIRTLQRFSCENYLSTIAGCIEELELSEGGSRLDPLLELIAAQLGEVPQDARLLVASTKGELDRLESAYRAGETVPGDLLFEPLLAKISQRFGLRDQGMNINAACASSTVALARGAALIANGQAESVLVYAADLVSEYVYSGFSALQALSDTAAKPFDTLRQGLNLGEAGVALLLQSEERALRQAQSPLACIAGWGAANDAHHVTAPARDGSGLILACQAALQQAGIETQQVAAINAHGTATLYNDAMELTAFNRLFALSLPPLHGIKGSIGHCLGPAGGLEALVGCYALAQQLIPGTVGCTEPEEAGQGRISCAPQKIAGEYLLSTNSGFGGVNAALILQRVAL